ncbi:MAG: hypothetical protein ACJAXX_001282 [Roseivirga sp.]|jgi:hypothetical protein
MCKCWGSTYCRITETTYEITYENRGLVTAMPSSDDDGFCQPTDDNILIILPELYQIILDLDDHPCTKQLFENIQALTSTGIKGLIERFAGTEARAFNYKIGIDDSGNNTGYTEGGQTTHTGDDYTFQTSLNMEFLNGATDVAIARTLMHELIHAYLLSSFSTSDALFESDFPKAYALYLEDLNTDSTPDEALQHEQIADKYSNYMEIGLKEMFGNRFNDTFYKRIAMGGLVETDWYKNNTDITNYEKRRIKDTNNWEDHNMANAQGRDCND